MTTQSGNTSVRPGILRILEETDAGPSWFLTAARFEAIPQPSAPMVIPTILLFCSNPQKCRTVLEKVDTGLRIEVRMGGVQFRADDLEHPASPFYFDKAKMGVGVGVEGSIPPEPSVATSLKRQR